MLSNNEGETATCTVELGLFAIELFVFITMVDLNFVAKCSAFLVSRYYLRMHFVIPVNNKIEPLNSISLGNDIKML